MSIRVTADAVPLRALIIDIDHAAVGIKDRVVDVFDASGPMFVRTMKRIVPKDTRTLEKSLAYSVNRRNVTLRLGSLKTNKNPKSGRLARTYAGYVHDGTSRMPPRPFIQQAIDRHTTDQSGFMRGLRKAGVGNIGRSTGGSRI